MDQDKLSTPSRKRPANHQRGASKVARIPIKIVSNTKPLRKPHWIRSQVPIGTSVARIKTILRRHQLSSVCEEALCPNLCECFSNGTATFMIMGDLCTRRCPFCDVAHGKPQPLNPDEPQQLAAAIKQMELDYVVITSVNRDDLRDGGAAHFVACIESIRRHSAKIRVEVLVPDFRGRQDGALALFAATPPDVFNHNLETIPRLYRSARPGASYEKSLELLRSFKRLRPKIKTKSGLMLGLGEKLEEVLAVLHDLKAHDCDMLTIGQYLQPSRYHLPVARYITPQEFSQLESEAVRIGFSSVACAPMVRSSYHADKQAIHLEVR